MNAARTLAIGYLFLCRCGGKAVIDGEEREPECVASTDACTIAGAPVPVNACSECVNDAICQCRDLNPPSSWELPEDCEVGSEKCSGPLPTIHACRVAAVGLVKCMLTDADCAALYFAAHPEETRPLGMAYGLYTCAVCSSCAAECAATPFFPIICTPL